MRTILILLSILGLFAIDAAFAEERKDAASIRHVIDRLTYGPSGNDLEIVSQSGINHFIDQQLHPESISLPAELIQQLSELHTLTMTPVQLFKEYGPPLGKDKDAAKNQRLRARIILEEASQGRMLRATESPRQLYEVMVEFWFNHFNIFAGKGLDHLWVGAYEEQAIRPYAMGRFRDLLGATAKHPGMLFYLDNWQNTDPYSSGARGKFDGLNENYARELMELHTLGVDGGYSQQDVVALAKIFTGWGLRPAQEGRLGHMSDARGFYFDPKRHDFSDKTFLGHTIHGRGIQEGEEAMDILASSPITAKRISYKLAQYFVSDDPPASLVDKLAKRFQSTDGDIRAVLETLFHSDEFWYQNNIHTKFKTPYQYVISTMRAANVTPENIKPVLGVMAQLGMPLYGCLTPDGYKNTETAWVNPDSLLRRLDFATALASGKLPIGKQVQVLDLMEQKSPINSEFLKSVLTEEFSAETLHTVDEAPPQLRSALLLGSREFMYR